MTIEEMAVSIENKMELVKTHDKLLSQVAFEVANMLATEAGYQTVR